MIITFHLSCEVVHPFFTPPHVSYPFFKRGGMLFYTHTARMEGGWLEILSFRRSIAFQIARRGRGGRGLVEFHGGIEWDPTRASRGPQTKRKGLYILRHYPFRGRSIRLRGKISIRNDIERLIRKGWNPLCLELDFGPSPFPAAMIIFFFFFLLFFPFGSEINTSCFEMAFRVHLFAWELFQQLFVRLCCEFVKVFKKNKRLDVSLIFKLEAWIAI